MWFEIWKNRKGVTFFTSLLALLLIVLVIGVVIATVKPGKRMAETRDLQRWTDANKILEAGYQYYLRNNFWPDQIFESTGCPKEKKYEVCRLKAKSCSGLTDLSPLVGQYGDLVDIPIDPHAPGSNGTGYYIATSPDGRVTVCAPFSETEDIIAAYK